MLEVNLVAPFLLTKAFGTKMLAVKRGGIVNVASVAGLVGIADRAAYNGPRMEAGSRCGGVIASLREN